MKDLFVYAEDGLTLWLLKDNLKAFLDKCQDSSPPDECNILYRPSFARGLTSFGDFDAIVLSKKCLYLCESKWSAPGKKPKRETKLKVAQSTRHKVFKSYLQEYAYGGYQSWDQFRKEANPKMKKQGKPIPSSTSLLARNLCTVLNLIRQRFDSPPKVSDILIYFHAGRLQDLLHHKVLDECGNEIDDFTLVPVDYKDALGPGNYISISS